MRKQTFRYVWFLSILVAAGLGCNAVTDIGQRVSGVRNTAQSIATSVEGGSQLFATGQAIITQVQNNDLVKTAEAVATQQGPALVDTAEAFATQEVPSLQKTVLAVATDQGPGVAATLQSMATNEVPGLEETLQAFATEEGPGLVETAQAYATEQGPGLEETVSAAATEFASSMGQPPEDIPLVDGQKDQLFSSSSFISYFTAMDFASVEQFYIQKMPENGWTQDKSSSVTTGNSAVLVYDKANRRATVTISVNPLDSKTVVLITIGNK